MRGRQLRQVVIAAAAVVVVIVGVSGCVRPSGFELAKAELATRTQHSIDTFHDLLTSVSDPRELEDRITMEVGTDLSTLTPDELQEFGGLTATYDLDVETDTVIIRMVTMGTSESGGGWSAEQDYVYSCLQLTGTIGKVPDVKFRGETCDSQLVESALQGTPWNFVPFTELGHFSTE